MVIQESNTSKAVKGMSSQTIVTIVLGVIEIASFSIMSRLLTQQDFGYYAAISAITIIFSTFSETGIGSAIVQQKELTQRYINNAFTISLLFGGFVSVLMLALSAPLAHAVADDSMRVPLMLMSGTLILNCLASVNIGIMLRKLQFMRIGGINLVALILTTCVAIWLAYQGYGYYAIITKAVLSSFLIYVFSLFFCKTKFGLALDKDTFNKILSFSGWLMASGLFRNLAHQIDRLLMPRLLSIDALGAYNRPKDFVEQMSSKIAGIFDTVLFPVLSSIQDDKRAIYSSFNKSLHLLNIVSLFLALAFMFNSGLVIRIFFGNQWMDLKPIMMVLSFILLFNFNGRLADCYLRSLAMTKQQFFFRIFETIINVMGVLVGYQWGILGVAIAIVTTNMIAKFIKVFYIGSVIGLRPLQTLQMIVSAWRYALVLIPVCAMGFIVFPNSWGGDVLMVALFCFIVICLFIGTPHFVGDCYYSEVFVKISSFLRNTLNKNRISCL